MNEHARADLKNADGTWKYTNALARETSPYLLQHAHNPVDWHPWGPAAFELARRSDKPIFLSIGYSTCYWCHVMERQVFENPQLAGLLNEHFVSIKVDREERPDVDDVYMMSVQMMTRHGGWPMSVFLTPPGAAGADDAGLRPFWAGTYIPPVGRQGLPGFADVVHGLSNAWRDRRGEVVEAGARISETVASALSRRDVGGRLDIQLVSDAVTQFLRTYDAEHGGFGTAPKFPMPVNLLLLLAVQRNNPDEDLGHALTHTLDRMARGGMYDQIGGGFHRYSTDEKWLVPHFEKMLYDNGLLVETYLTAQALRPDPRDPTLYPRIVRQTCDYVLREMLDVTGAIWSAQDAEVDAREGGNYLWQPSEVREAVADGDLAELALRLYGLDGGSNFRDPHLPGEPPANVLYVPCPLAELAEREKMSLDELLEKKREIDRLLLAVRDRRRQPGTDDKVLVSWNGLMIAALARAGRDLGEPRYLAAAAKAARYILDHMRRQDGGLFRTMRRGAVKIPAFLEDYAFFVHALVELHRADHQGGWLDSAVQLVGYADERFADEHGGFYDTLADQGDLFVRVRSTYDGAAPTGNSQMAHDLLDLHELTGEAAYLHRATACLASFAGALERMGVGMAHMQHALLRAIERAPRLIGATADKTRTAESAEPVVRVFAEPPRIDLRDTPATVRVIVEIAEGYHLNAHSVSDPAVTPTSLILTETAGMKLEVAYPPGLMKQFPYSEAPLSVYEGRVELAVTVERTIEPRSVREPALLLRYQACTQDSCLEAARVRVPLVMQ